MIDFLKFGVIFTCCILGRSFVSAVFYVFQYMYITGKIKRDIFYALHAISDNFTWVEGG